MLKVGLIGCGGIGAVHAKCWIYMNEKTELAAVADANTEKAESIAKICGAAVYSDAEEMLKNEKLDVVDICLPTALHTRFATLAMKYVKNVIIEKPICLTEEDARLLLATEKETGACVQVAHIVRFGTAHDYLKQVFDSKEYGEIKTGTFIRISPKPVWVNGYNDVTRTGGMQLDLQIHNLDFIRYLMGGDPENVGTVIQRGNDGVIEHLFAHYRYGDALFTDECSWEYPTSMPFKAGYRVRFEGATLVSEGEDVTVYPEDGEAFKPKLEERAVMDLGINVSNFGDFLKELGSFADAINEGRTEVSLKDAIAAFRLSKLQLEKELL